MRNLESVKNPFWFPNDQSNPVERKSMHEFNTKILFQFDEEKYICRIKYTNDKLNCNYVSLSDHPLLESNNKEGLLALHVSLHARETLN